MTDRPLHIVFAIFPGVTQLDFTGPHQVFSRLSGARVTVAAARDSTICADGLNFAGLVRLCDIPDCNVLCVPGGYGATEAALDEEFVLQVRRLAGTASYVTSVCTGSLILGSAGLLGGRRAASHWAWRHLLPLFGAEMAEQRVVRDGNIFTGGGVTAGIDLALTVVAELAGEDVAQQIQLSLEYAPAPPFNSGRPESAPPEVLAGVRKRMEAALAKREAEAETAAARLRSDSERS
jgi:transcriptional regulator GlxA family with amidase domain